MISCRICIVVGLLISLKQKRTVAFTANTSLVDKYQCFDGTLINLDFFCDGVGDCDDKSDEERCYSECIQRHDILGSAYAGNRTISADGDRCVNRCSGQQGNGVICNIGQRTYKYCHVPFCQRHGGADMECDFSSSFCGWKVRSNASIITKISEDGEIGVIEMRGRHTNYFVLANPLAMETEALFFDVTFNITVQAELRTYWTYLVGNNRYRLLESNSSFSGWTNTECKSCANTIYGSPNMMYLYFLAFNPFDFNVTVTIMKLSANNTHNSETYIWTVLSLVTSPVQLMDGENYCAWNEYPCRESGICIPIPYTLDNYKDCPLGDDLPAQLYPLIQCENQNLNNRCLHESQWSFVDNNKSCPGTFQCRGDIKHPLCLDDIDICDGNPNCPHWDDEIYCHQTCPSGCEECSSNVYRCLPSSWDIIPQQAPAIDLSGNAFNIDILCSSPRPSLKVLRLSKCGLESFGCVTKATPISYINYLLPSLEALDLSYNSLTEVYIPGNNRELSVDLSGNPLTSFQFLHIRQVVIRRSSLQEFYLIYNPERSILYFNRTDWYLYNRWFLVHRVLRVLDVSQNEIKTFSIECLFDMDVLNISHNELTYLQTNQLSQILFLRELYLNNNRLTFLPKISKTYSLRILNANNNFLIGIENESLQNMSELYTVFLRNNKLKTVNHSMLYGVFNLNHLDLGHNALKALPGDVFKDQSNLEVLNLDNNKLTYIQREVFVNLRSLLFLDLRGNDIDVYDGMFGELGVLQDIFVQDSVLCCARPVSVSDGHCFVQIKTLSSCNYLLSEPYLAVFIWFISLTIIMLNIYSARRCRRLLPHNHIHLYILPIPGVLVGIYLLMIAFKDLESKGIYGYHHNNWRKGNWCLIIRILALLHVEGSTVYCLFASVIEHLGNDLRDRFLKGYKTKIAVVIMSVPLVISALLRTVYDGNIGNSRQLLLGICSPFFYLDYPTEVVFSGQGMYTLLTIGPLVVITVVAIVIKAILVVFHNCRSRWNEGLRNKTIISGITLLVVSRNIAIVFCALLPFRGVWISIEIYTWISVLVVPLDSVIIPLLLLLLHKENSIQVKDVLPYLAQCNGSNMNFISLVIATDSGRTLKSGINVSLKDASGKKREARDVKTIRNFILCDAPVYQKDRRLMDKADVQLMLKEMMEKTDNFIIEI